MQQGVRWGVMALVLDRGLEEFHWWRCHHHHNHILLGNFDRYLKDDTKDLTIVDFHDRRHKKATMI